MKFSSNIEKSHSWIIEKKDQLEINWSHKAISEHLQKENSFNFYLLDNDHPIGVLIGHFLYQDQKVSEFEILHIAVLPKFRNQGLGRMILEELEKQLKSTGKSVKIFLEASAVNKFAIKLYEKLGYKAYNERKNYYGSNPINPSSLQDAILFAKTLNASS
ncbi:MAG: GNAT family N-acetyltransferase [Alphaproteobacteria bacterium]